MLKRLLVVVFGLAIFASCKTSPTVSSVANIYDSEWKLVSVRSPESGNRLIIKADQKPTLLFDKSTGNVSGFAGCNRLNGAVKVEGNTIKFDRVASTNKFCQDSMATENAVMKALEATNTFEIKGGKLFLKEGTKVVAEYIK